MCNSVGNPCWHTWDTLMGGGGSLFCTNPVCDPFQLKPGALPVLRMLSVQSTAVRHTEWKTPKLHTLGAEQERV